MADPGARRRMIARPRRGFLGFLLKLTIILLLVMGGIGAVAFLTPPETKDTWKEKAREFLKPGAVLRDYLPFKVSFLDELAEEENSPSAAPLPSAQAPPNAAGSASPTRLLSGTVTEGPNPQARADKFPRRTNRNRFQGFDPGLETLGKLAVELFYRGQSIKERARVLVDPVASLPDMWAFYQRYPKLPTLKSIAYRGPVRDAVSDRWFGVFDVRENENEEIHRWAVAFDGGGSPKVDWILYQQLNDDSLNRFLADPAAPPKEFRLLLRRGSDALLEGRPNSAGIVVLMKLRLYDGPPQRITLGQKDFVEFGMDRHLVSDHSRLARLQLAWTDSEDDPDHRTPTIIRVIGWGAW